MALPFAAAAAPLAVDAKPAQFAKAVHEAFPFAALCALLEQIAAASAKAAKVAVLEKLWASRRGSDFLPFMRLLIPHLDTQRATYGLRESKIARYYIDLLGLSATSADAIRFRHWKDPSKNAIDTTHFSDVVFVVLSRRGYAAAAGAAPLTVADVNRHLDQLAASAAVEEKKATLMLLLRSCSAVEQKWIIRFITKEMKMHLQHTSILAAFHPNAMELYHSTNDLAYVCQRCTDPAELTAAGDMKTGIFLMQPLRPMLASVVDSAKLGVLLKDEKLLLEPKYDGERMMIHKNGGKVMYWTRNAKNYTATYGPKFDKVILDQLHDVDNCILDGEFMLYDAAAKRFKDFGQNRTFATSGVAFADVAAAQEWFCYCVFDIVFLNGESLVALPLLKRRSILQGAVRPLPTMLEVVPATVATNVKSVLAALDAALANQYEGILIKIAGSAYVPGERKLKWLKLKPDHIAGMADTVDLVILGGFYGTKYGVRQISHFLLGVWADAAAGSAAAPDARFHTVCKVGTGYAEAELRDLLDGLEAKWLTSPHAVPAWLDGWVPARDDLPDVYIHPRDSVVMEVFGYSFVDTVKFRVGSTIRFPRCHRLRHDKAVGDATTLSHLRTIIAASGTFAVKAEAMDELVMVRQQKRQRKADEKAAAARQHELLRERRAVAHVSRLITTPLAGDVAVVSDLFSGYELCVLHSNAADAGGVARRELETLFIANGGDVSANPGPLTSIIVASSATAPKVANWIAACRNGTVSAKYERPTTDVVSVAWVTESVARATVLPFAPRSMVYSSPRLLEQFAVTLDRYEDSYGDHATADMLRASAALANAAAPPALPGGGGPDGDGLAALTALRVVLRRDAMGGQGDGDWAGSAVVAVAADDVVDRKRHRDDTTPARQACRAGSQTAAQRSELLRIALHGGAVVAAVDDATHTVGPDGSIAKHGIE
jgi:DNA ligase-4